MCTAINLHGYRHLFGRTLDLECSYGECAVIAPRGFGFDFLYEGRIENTPNIIGIAAVRDGVPLFYDAINEYGLGVAALNFPAYAKYQGVRTGAFNIASYELIPWVLTVCKSTEEAKALLSKTNITQDAFSADMPQTPLHWIISDRERSIVAEPQSDGLSVYENPYEVLTNSPPFPYQTAQLARYMGVGAVPQENRLCPDVGIGVHTRGLGGVGLPGDYTSEARFVRTVFAKTHTFCENNYGDVSRFFHILDTVSVPDGAVIAENGRRVRTVYTSCADLAECEYFFTTYENRRIRKLKIRGGGISRKELSVFPIHSAEDIEKVN